MVVLERSVRLDDRYPLLASLPLARYVKWNVLSRQRIVFIFIFCLRYDMDGIAGAETGIEKDERNRQRPSQRANGKAYSC